MDKEKKKIIRRKIGWFFIKLFTFFNGVLPLSWAYFSGAVFGCLAYLGAVRLRRIAQESLGIAFPGEAPAQRKKIARDFFVFMAQSSLELMYFLRHERELARVRMEGEQNLKEAQVAGKGVLMITAHLGNFALMSFKLAKAGYRVNVVIRPMRDAKAGGYFHSLRDKAGIGTILSYPRKECVSNIIKSLRRNEIVIMLMDQNFGTGGVWVNFFGKSAATPVGPIVFGMRTGAAIVPAYIYREGRGRHCLKLLAPQPIILTEDKDETILLNAVKFTRLIESWIKQFPCQWSWIHRRWKSRPSEEIQNLRFKIERPAGKEGSVA